MGWGFPRDCGESLVFSKETVHCVEHWELEECHVDPPVTLVTTKRNDCEMNECEEDGAFSEGRCLDHYCKCWNGFGWIEQCMEPLKFDGERGTCHWGSDSPERREIRDTMNDNNTAGCGITGATGNKEDK